MAQRAEAHKSELIERAAGLAAARLGKDRGAVVERFIRQLYANVPPDDLRGDSVDAQFGPGRIEAIRADLEKVLADVRAAVTDWPAMREKVAEIIAELDQRPPPLPADEVAEGRDFLAWIEDNHYTYLGYRDYAFTGEG